MRRAPTSSIAMIGAAVAMIVGGQGCSSPPNEPGPPGTGVVLSETRLESDGTVRLEFAGYDTVAIAVRNGLTGAPVAVGTVLGVASREEGVVCAVFPDTSEHLQPRFFYLPASSASMTGRAVDFPWLEVFPWIGGPSPVSGVHSSFQVPRWAWEMLRCHITSHGSGTIRHMHEGAIRATIEGWALGQVALAFLAIAYPPAAPLAVVVSTVVSTHSNAMMALQEVQLLIFSAQGYCLDQEVALKKLWGFCQGEFRLGWPLLEPVEGAPQCLPTATGRVYGYITDASTGLLLPGVDVRVNGVPAITSSGGHYSVDNVLGNPHVPVEASLTGYQVARDDVAVPPGGSVRKDMALVPRAPDAGDYRLVLTWGANPADLDAHVWVPLAPGVHAHVYYANQGSLTSPPYAQLDVDDTSGYGPETITVRPQYAGRYEWAVHEYGGSGTLATSNAVVRIYRGDSLVQTVHVPTTTCGERWWWYVATLDMPTGGLNVVNRLQESPPVGGAMSTTKLARR